MEMYRLSSLYVIITITTHNTHIYRKKKKKKKKKERNWVTLPEKLAIMQFAYA